MFRLRGLATASTLSALAVGVTAFGETQSASEPIVATSVCADTGHVLIKRQSKKLVESLDFESMVKTEALEMKLRDLPKTQAAIALMGCVKAPKKNMYYHTFTYNLKRENNKQKSITHSVAILIQDGRFLSWVENEWPFVDGLGKTFTSPDMALIGRPEDISDDPDWFKEQTTIGFDPIDAD